MDPTFKNIIIIIAIIFVFIVVLIGIISIVKITNKESYELDKYESVSDLEAVLTDETDDCKSDIEISWSYPPQDLLNAEDYTFTESDNITFSYYIGEPSKSIITSKKIYKPLNNEWYYLPYIPGTTKYSHTLIGISLDRNVNYKIVMYITNTDVTKVPRARDSKPAYSNEVTSDNKNDCNKDDITCRNLLNQLRSNCPKYQPSCPDIGSLKYNSIPYVDTDKSVYQLNDQYSTSITIKWEYTNSSRFDTNIQFNYNITSDGTTYLLTDWSMLSYSNIKYYNATINVKDLHFTTNYRIVMYVSSSSSAKSKYQDSDKTYSSIFTVKEYIETDLTLIIDKTNSPKIYTDGTDKEIIIKWTVNCNDNNYCPSDFIFSVDIEGKEDSGDGILLFPFYYLSKNGDSFTVTLNKLDYIGTLNIGTPDTNTGDIIYTFKISPLLPVGYIYDVTVMMYRWTGDETYETYEDNATNLFSILKHDTPYSTPKNICIEYSTYDYSMVNTINIQIQSNDDYDGNMLYKFNVYIKKSNKFDIVENTLISHHLYTNDSCRPNIQNCQIEGTAAKCAVFFFLYTLQKFPQKSNEFDNNNRYIKLTPNNTYKIGVQVCERISHDDYIGKNCSEIGYSNEFTIVECDLLNNQCDNSYSETNLLENDSYAKIAYETNCSYTDNIELCMANQGYDFDQREIPMTCQYNSTTKANVCSRKVCPPMSVPYSTDGSKFTAGCITPLNTNYNSDTNFNYSFNEQLNNKAASYEKDGSVYNDLDYGFPFISIIEGGTSDTDGKEPVYDNSSVIDITTQKIAVPGMTDGKIVYLMPVDLQNFHPFIAWRTFSTIDPNTPYKPLEGVKIYSNNNNVQMSMYSLYHIGSNKYLDTNTKMCKSSKKDNGKSCNLKLTNINELLYPTQNYDPNDNNANACVPFQKNGQVFNSCITSNIWLNRIDAEFNTNPSVDWTTTKPRVYNTGNSTVTNNWNVPIDDKQNMVFFGKDITEYASLYHRNDNNKNKISHMRRWIIGDTKNINSYFWKNGLGKGSSDYKEVYLELQKQWPNGPPYTAPLVRGIDINFSAPIQYGIVPYYDQNNFYLEVYTWDETYSTFKGIGFIARNTEDPYNGFLSNDITKPIYKWKNPSNSQNGGITWLSMVILIDNYYANYYMRYTDNNFDSKYMLMTFSASSLYMGDIFFLQNGYILLQISSQLTYNYYLCVSNTDKKLYWVKKDAKLDIDEDPSFTPIMLAMSWAS